MYTLSTGNHYQVLGNQLRSSAQGKIDSLSFSYQLMTLGVFQHIDSWALESKLQTLQAFVIPACEMSIFRESGTSTLGHEANMAHKQNTK